MKAIVCVKQVPDTSGVVAVKADGTMDRAAMDTITNHDDLAAVEAALDLKDQTGCEVVVVSMGPPPAEGMLRELIAMGADRAVLISAREFGGSDTYATSQIIAAAVNKIGVEADDLPQVTYAADIKKEGNKLTVKRLLEDGHMMLSVETPCLITTVKELNEPRYMNVGLIQDCYDKPLEIFDYEALKNEPLIDPDTIGLEGSPTNVYKSFSPPAKGACQMLEGNDRGTVDKLTGILADKHLI